MPVFMAIRVIPVGSTAEAQAQISRESTLIRIRKKKELQYKYFDYSGQKD